jgi:class 3 adenylate cyclase
MTDPSSLTVYLAPPKRDGEVKRLVVVNGGNATFEFTDRIEVGRYRDGETRNGILLVKDPTVSSRHCVITQEPGGRCFVRDTSRNGCRLEGRRLSPNSKTAFDVGQMLSVGQHLSLRLEGAPADTTPHIDPVPSDTIGVADATLVTNLVGDIRNFTTLVQNAPPQVLQASVSRVFARLEEEVVRLGGTLKEFQGDALFAFWERGATVNHVTGACRAALALRRLSEDLARDPDVWSVEDHPLEMDFALTTGLVSISGYGSGNIYGLSMVGESVVLAFRIEEIAGDETGPIVACPDTQFMAAREFEFKDLGPQMAKGFDEPQQVYALVREKRP